MKLGNEYTLEIVVANDITGCYGDIYKDINQMLKEHPDSPYMFGYFIAKHSGESEFADWYYTIEDALKDFYELKSL